MKRPLFIGTSDWHIAPGAWKYRAIQGDSYYSLQQIIDTAISFRVPIVAAGDLYNVDDPEPEAVAFVNRQLDRLEEVGVPLYYLQGQHEWHRCGRWLETHRHPIHLHKKQIQINGVTLYGLDWTPAGRLQGELENIPPGTQVFCCHQVWAEFMGSVAKPEGAIAEIPYAENLIVLTGDYHAQVCKEVKAANGRSRLIYSPGAIAMQSVDETPEKGFWLFELTDHGIAGRKIALDTRPVYAFELYTAEALESFLDDIAADLFTAEFAELMPENLRKPILSIKYYDDLPEVYPRLMTTFGERTHLFLSALTRSRPVLAPLSARREAGRGCTLISELGRVVPESSGRFSRLKRLLSTGDPPAELQAVKDEFFAEVQ